MGEVERADGLVRMSIARLAAEFGMARETVSKKLALASVQPDGKRNGYPVYRLRDACAALFTAVEVDGDGNVDPRTLPADKRNAWYQSEMRRMEVELRARMLVPANEVETQISELVKTWVQFLDTLADQLERDVGLSPEQVDALNTAIARQRAAAQDRMAGGEESDVRLSG